MASRGRAPRNGPAHHGEELTMEDARFDELAKRLSAGAIPRRAARPQRRRPGRRHPQAWAPLHPERQARVPRRLQVRRPQVRQGRPAPVVQAEPVHVQRARGVLLALLQGRLLQGRRLLPGVAGAGAEGGCACFVQTDGGNRCAKDVGFSNDCNGGAPELGEVCMLGGGSRCQGRFRCVVPY